MVDHGSKNMNKKNNEMGLVFKQIMDVRLTGLNEGMLDNGSVYMKKIYKEVSQIFQQ